jgi:peptide/nickel transport system permease protein
MGLLRYFARRVLFAVLLVFLVSSGALLLTRLAPGDFTSELFGTNANLQTLARERARYGLDRPILEQYAVWLGRAVRMDLGRSLMYGRPVSELIGQRALNSALLAVVALGIATLAGIPLGVVSGSRRGGWIPALIRGGSLVCLSLPPLLTSLLFVLVAARTGWLPIGGMTSVDAVDMGWLAWARDLAWHLPVPALALGLPVAATLERLQAQAMAEAVSEPCVLSAFGRGVPPGRLIWRDAWRVALRPVASIYGLIVGSLLSGSFVVEIVTAWPGLGRLMFDALRARDLYLVAGCASAGAVFLAAGSLLSDVALAIVDPRLRGD